MFRRLATPVIVQPHATHRLEHHECAQQCADEGDQAVEDGDCAGDYVGDYGDGEGAGEPDDFVS